MTEVLSLWKGLITVPEPHPVDPRPPGGMRVILAETARDHGLHQTDLMSLSRVTPIVRARWDFMWRCRQVKWPDGSCRYSLPMIANVLGGMDHTTIMHGVRRHTAIMGALEAAGTA